MDINLRITVDDSATTMMDRLINALNDLCLGLKGTREHDRGSKPVVDVSLSKPQPVDKPTPEASTEKTDKAATVVYSKDDVVMILQSLAKNKGDKSVSKTLLGKFGATKVSDLKTEDYGAIIIAAEEMM